MKPEQKPTTVGAESAAPANLTGQARRAWSVNVVLPQPKSMPSDRLKARADLVRNALSSQTY